MELYSGYTGRITMPHYKRLPMPMMFGEAAIFLNYEEGLSLWKALEHTPLTYVDEHVTVFHRSLAQWVSTGECGMVLALHDGVDLSRQEA